MTAQTELKGLINTVASGASLSRDQAEIAFHIMMSGDATPSQMGGLLMGLRVRGETIDEVTGAALAMRHKMTAITAPEGAIDTVGTGGDAKGSWNVSTAVAFVVAGCGVPVAKHGNRNLSSNSGAADALGQLGVNVMVGADVVEAALGEAGLAFMMAPMHHPAIRHVMPARAELGTRTIFNILGPLTNPAGVRRQLTGAFALALIRPMAEALGALGAERAWVVHGSDGTDEITITGPTAVAALEAGRVNDRELHPEDAGLPVHPFESILGGTPAENGAAFAALLDGAEGAYRDAVLLNAAAALVIADAASDLKEGVTQARASIDSGAAKTRVQALARITSEAA